MTKRAKTKKRTQGMNWVRKEKRLAIYLRDGMTCSYCGGTIEDGATLTLDHIIPYSHGGSNSETNLVTCCGKCNSMRQDRKLDVWLDGVSGYINIDSKKIMSYVKKQIKKNLTPFKKEAKEIMARRPNWADCLK